jgi:alpha-N-arabinofuranosidase
MIHLSLVNIDPNHAVNIRVELKGMDSGEVKGLLLGSEKLDSHNSFTHAEEVVPVEFTGAHFKNGLLELTVPPHSVVVLEVD